MDVLNGSLRRLGLVKDHESLTLRLEVCLGHDINHVAILGKEGTQGLLERLGLDALLQITDINPAKLAVSFSLPVCKRSDALYVSECNDTYVAMGCCAAMFSLCSGAVVVSQTKFLVLSKV